MFVWFEAVFLSYLPFFKVCSHLGSLYSWLPHQRWITVWSPSCVSSGCGLYEISVPVTMVVDLEEGLRTETASEWKEKCTWSQCVYDTIFCFQVHFQWLASLYSSWCMLLSYKVLFCSVKRTTIELNNFLPVNIFLCHCRSFEKKTNKKKHDKLFCRCTSHSHVNRGSVFCWFGVEVISVCVGGFALFAQWSYFRACVIVFEFQLGSLAIHAADWGGSNFIRTIRHFRLVQTCMKSLNKLGLWGALK